MKKLELVGHVSCEETGAGWLLLGGLQGRVLGKIPELLAMIHSVLSVAWLI